MDTSRLLAAIDHIIAAYERSGMIQRLQELHQLSGALLSAPANQDHLTAFKVGIVAFDKSLSELTGASLPAGMESILRRVGAGNLLPDDLGRAVRKVLESTAPSLQSVTTELGQIGSQAAATFQMLQQSRTAMKKLGIKPFVVAEGQWDVGVYIPGAVTKDDLEVVQNQLEEWTRVFKTAMEIGSGKVGTVQLTGVESDSFDFHVSFDIEGAKAFLLMIGGIIGMFGLANKYKKKREELEEDKFPPSVTDALKKEEEALQEKEIKRTVDRVAESASPTIEPGRKNELRTQIRVCIEFIVDSMSQGVRVEVLPPPAPKSSATEATEPGDQQILEVKLLVLHVETGLRRIERGELPPPELTAGSRASEVSNSDSPPSKA